MKYSWHARWSCTPITSSGGILHSLLKLQRSDSAWRPWQDCPICCTLHGFSIWRLVPGSSSEDEWWNAVHIRSWPHVTSILGSESTKLQAVGDKGLPQVGDFIYPSVHCFVKYYCWVILPFEWLCHNDHTKHPCCTQQWILYRSLKYWLHTMTNYSILNYQ